VIPARGALVGFGHSGEWPRVAKIKAVSFRLPELFLAKERYNDIIHSVHVVVNDIEASPASAVRAAIERSSSLGRDITKGGYADRTPRDQPQKDDG
jgi:hypothetical protein